MRRRERVMLVGGAGLVGAVVIGIAFLTSRETGAPPSLPPEFHQAPRPVEAAVVAPKRTAPVRATAPEQPHATVVPPSPGDVPPEPEVANAPAQPNDPIEEEQPQTARWKLEKTEHITSLLGRDVTRLEGEKQEARARGDSARIEQVEALLQRHRVRLDELREEARLLTEAARNEPPEP
ncbi:hypothetical protein OV208_36010 [Corallococcus sp. bb12-1]|uniref:hypothetical protein n=1 Tax=Corallococcus sp. bb12-1 TaxID=2996784 RepID=UPI00226F0939|nr:hypothetical protein [Corallococcus sp. bb12-1]MCY1046765.1 hypothetical protein [Corallococcus sp. bb12-1]